MWLEHAEAALELVVEDGNVEAGLEAQVRRLLCEAKWAVGDLEGAVAECLVAFEVLAQDPDHEMMAFVEQSTGRVLVDLGRYDEAYPHAENLVRLAEDGDEAKLLAFGHALLGEINEVLGRYAAAEKHFRAGFAWAQVEPTGTYRASWGAGLARVVAGQGRFEDAWDLLEEVTETSRKGDPFHQASIFEARGFIKHLQGRRKGAADDYQQALDYNLASGRTRQVEHLCRTSPVELSDCARLGYSERGARRDPAGG